MNNTITKDDIVLASFPKSGKTWVRFFIGSYMNNLYDLNVDINWYNFIELAPGYQEVQLFKFDCPKFLFSHHKVVSKYFEGRDCIYLTRNFHDILVSMFFFCKNRENTKNIKGDMRSFVRNYNFKETAKTLNAHFKMLEASNKFMIMKYEDLIDSPKDNFKKIISFSKYDFNDEAFNKALDFSSFTSMKKMEGRDKGIDSNFHTRKAKVGGHKAYLNKRSIKLISDSMNEHFSKDVLSYYK